jgi:hypothetical protein
MNLEFQYKSGLLKLDHDFSGSNGRNIELLKRSLSFKELRISEEENWEMMEKGLIILKLSLLNKFFDFLMEIRLYNAPGE